MKNASPVLGRRLVRESVRATIAVDDCLCATFFRLGFGRCGTETQLSEVVDGALIFRPLGHLDSRNCGFGILFSLNFIYHAVNHHRKFKQPVQAGKVRDVSGIFVLADVRKKLAQTGPEDIKAVDELFVVPDETKESGLEFLDELPIIGGINLINEVECFSAVAIESVYDVLRIDDS